MTEPPGHWYSREEMRRFPGMLILGAVVVFAQSPPVPIIRVPVRLVTVPVLVFDADGRLALNLPARDFHVLDEGRPQKISFDYVSAPVSIALVVQEGRDVRDYVAFIRKVGSVVDALLVGETGEAAVVTYGSEVKVVKPFDSGEVSAALKALSTTGRGARMIDAGVTAIRLLRERPPSRDRVIVWIGQSRDSGSESALAALQELAEKQSISVYAIALPEAGKAFVSDTFSIRGPTFEERGGFTGGADLGNLIEVLRNAGAAAQSTDPFTSMTGATGGTQFHVRKQQELETALSAIGVELRSLYLLSFTPASAPPGRHRITVQVDRPGARVFARPGYWLGAE